MENRTEVVYKLTRYLLGWGLSVQESIQVVAMAESRKVVVWLVAKENSINDCWTIK